MTTILEVHGLEKRFGGVIAAQNISVAVSAGETIGIIGANGAGKTTFVNMVTGHLPPTAGTIEFLGESILGLPTRKITERGLCRSFQVPQVFLSESVFDNVLVAYGIAEQSGLGMLQPLRDAAREGRVAAHLSRYQIAEHAKTPASELPQGVRKLLDIAMATVSKPQLLMLDEPTSGISVEEKFDLMEIIMTALMQEQCTVMFIEHDMEIVQRHVARVLAFSQGEIICDAPTAEAMIDPKVVEFVLGQEYHVGHRQDA